MSQVSHKKIIKIALIILAPLLVAGILAIIAATGGVSIPLLAGLTFAAIGAIVFIMTAGAALGLTGLLVLMQKSLRQLTSKPIYGYLNIILLVSANAITITGLGLYGVSLGVFAGLGALGGPLAIGIISIAIAAILLIVLYRTIHAYQQNSMPIESPVLAEPVLKEEFISDAPTPNPQPENTKSFKEVPVNIYDWKQDETLRLKYIEMCLSERVLAKSGFKKSPLLPGQNPETEWTTKDLPELRQFFSELHKVVRELRKEYPEHQISEIIIMRINECKSGLLRRYHPDKCKSNIFDRINALSLFKLPDHELYKAVINYYGPLAIDDLRSEGELSYYEAEKAGAIERAAQQRMLDEEEKKRQEDIKQNRERIEKNIAESQAQLEVQLQESKAEIEAGLEAMQAEVTTELLVKMEATMEAKMENFMQMFMAQQQPNAFRSSYETPMDAGTSSSFFKPSQPKPKGETKISQNFEDSVFQ